VQALLAQVREPPSCAARAPAQPRRAGGGLDRRLVPATVMLSAQP
jgi:hypothetical protein